MKTLIKSIYLLMAFCCLSFSHVYAGNEKKEEIKVEEEESIDDRKRSLLPLEVWLDEAILSVTFFDLPGEATVTILDVQTGEVISQTYYFPQTIYIPLTGRSGEFVIEISFNNRTFVGEFNI